MVTLAPSWLFFLAVIGGFTAVFMARLCRLTGWRAGLHWRIYGAVVTVGLLRRLLLALDSHAPLPIPGWFADFEAWATPTVVALATLFATIWAYRYEHAMVRERQKLAAYLSRSGIGGAGGTGGTGGTGGVGGEGGAGHGGHGGPGGPGGPGGEGGVGGAGGEPGKRGEPGEPGQRGGSGGAA